MVWVCYTKRLIPRLNTKEQYKIMRKNIYVQVSTHNPSYTLEEEWMDNCQLNIPICSQQVVNIMPQFFIFLLTSQLIMNTIHSSNLVKFI